MAVSYNKLWKLLVDKKMSKSDLRKKAEIAPNTMTKLRRDEEVSLTILSKICKTLHADFGDIVEYVPDADSDAFYGVDTKSAILKVNDELVNFYKTTSPWSNFSNIYGFSDTSAINGVFVNEEGAAVFSIDGRRLDAPQKGLNIIRTDKRVKKLHRK